MVEISASYPTDPIRGESTASVEAIPDYRFTSANAEKVTLIPRVLQHDGYVAITVADTLNQSMVGSATLLIYRHSAARGLRSCSVGGMLACMSDVTRILSAIEQGDPSAAEQLLPLVYEELRKLAAQRLANEKPGQTLQATALVHDAYLRLVGNQPPDTKHQPPKWNSRGHFFAAAAEAMRRILVESARRKNRLKHGRAHQRVDLDSGCLVSAAPSLDLLALDEALSRLATTEPAKVELVKLRYFAGLTMPEAASALDISLATAERYWTFAKSWLYAELADDA